jgi:Zn-dependent protease with chaperone function
MDAMATCPSCGTSIPVNPAFVSWCDKCEWNLLPTAPPRTTGRAAAVYDRLGLQLNTQLFEEVAAGDLARRRSWARTGAYAIATAVHALTAALIGFAVWLVAVTWPSAVTIVLALICLFTAGALLPRARRLRGKSGVLMPTDAPVLHRFAAAVGAPPPDLIRVDSNFNASMGRFGWRWRYVLTIGIPFWWMLTDQERVALIGHELGHRVNGDSTRGVFVGTALSALDEWQGTLRMSRPRIHNLAGVAQVLLTPFAWALAQIPRGLFAVLVRLSFRDSQRAEYRADALAARAGGSAAVQGGFDKVLLVPTAFDAIRRAVVRREDPTSARAVIAAAIGAVPEREVERRRRISRRELSKLDQTHPPTALRFDALTRRPVPATLVVDPGLAAALEQEMARFDALVSRVLFDRAHA